MSKTIHSHTKRSWLLIHSMGVLPEYFLTKKYPTGLAKNISNRGLLWLGQGGSSHIRH